MRCCGAEMKLVSVWDDPDSGYAWNLYDCIRCGRIVKQDVWNSAGTITINLNGTVTRNKEKSSDLL